ncbi:MAG: metallophosphoesterase family protein [Nitrososphaeria archaeon]
MVDSKGLNSKALKINLEEYKSVFVVGDLHGELETFHKIVESWRKEKDSCLIFLGDYADRGANGLEIIECLMKLEGKNVVKLKGNHEDYSPSGQPRFYPCTLIQEVERKYNWNTYFEQKLFPFFSNLYLTAYIPTQILFVHGGISSKIKSIKDLIEPTKEIEEDLLWSDPVEYEGEHSNMRGAGVEFGKDVTEKVLHNLGMNMIVRSHQPDIAASGPNISHNGKVITISSTGIYGGRPHYLKIETSKIKELKIIPKNVTDCVNYVE